MTIHTRHRLLLAGLVFATVLIGLGCPGGGGDPQQPGASPHEAIVRHNILGTAFLGQQTWLKAESAFREAATLAPGDPIPRNNIAVALLQQGKVDEAELQLREVLEIDSEFPHAHYNLGLIEKNRGNFEEAVRHFEVVSRIDPDDLITQYNLGIVYSRIGRGEEALQAYRNALARDPNHVSSLYGLGRLLLQGGEQDEGARLVALSQEVRARSGLDEAVGSQYGEQGPYALGIDYPGNGLSADPPIEVHFVAVAEGPLPGSGALGPAWTITREAGRTRLVAIDPDSGELRHLETDGWSSTGIGAGPDRTIVDLIAGGVAPDDGDPDLVAAVLGPDGLSFARLGGEREGWSDTEFSGAVPIPLDGPLSGIDLTLVDRDHDGDLDLLCCWNARTRGCAVGTNDGSARFEVTPSSAHGFGFPGESPGPVHVALTDFDNDRDVDLIVAGPSGLRVLANLRDGNFEDVTETAGLSDVVTRTESLEVVDLDKNGFMDLLLGGSDGAMLLLNRLGRFEDETPDPWNGTSGGVVSADYDNDGLIDVVAGLADGSIALYRNLGRGEFVAVDAVDGALPTQGMSRPLASFDSDGDGDQDAVVIGEAGLTLLSNEGGNARQWIGIDSRGIGDNTFGVGAKVEVLAGALRQKYEIDSPIPLHVGLGDRTEVESIRTLWPSGVLQDETGQPAGTTVEVTQLDRKGTSCPLLYAWDGNGWRFVTDFLGGAAIGYQKAPGRFDLPDTDEYVRIDGGIVPDADGSLRLRLNNQLEEVIWFDRTELIVVDHPEGSEVYPNERLMPGPPWPDFRLFASDEIRPVTAAHSIDGRTELSAALRDSDRRFVDDFASLPFKGYAESHGIELDLGPFEQGRRVVLLLDGWIDYADSSSNLAASQAGLSLQPPRLELADGQGGWIEPKHLMGFPAGLPKTMAVDLTGRFVGSDHRLRLTTNMRIYWDRARVMLGGDGIDLTTHRLSPVGSELRFGGFPRPIRDGGVSPVTYLASRVDSRGGWKAHVGSYTGWGDVTSRLLAIDDRFVTTRNGDEIELRFEPPGPLRDGFTRTYLLYADGFGKDMDPNSAASNEVGPIPFHGMPRYPYGTEVTPPLDDSGDTPSGRFVPPSSDGAPGALPQPLVGRAG